MLWGRPSLSAACVDQPSTNFVRVPQEDGFPSRWRGSMDTARARWHREGKVCVGAKAEGAERVLGSDSCKVNNPCGNAAGQNEPLYSLDLSNPSQKPLHSFFDSLYPPKASSSNSCHLYVFGLELHQAGFSSLSLHVLNIRCVRGQL